MSAERWGRASAENWAWSGTGHVGEVVLEGEREVAARDSAMGFSASWRE
jgi:hypothetical protein